MAYKLALGQINCTTELTGPTVTLGLATPLIARPIESKVTYIHTYV